MTFQRSIVSILEETEVSTGFRKILNIQIQFSCHFRLEKMRAQRFIYQIALRVYKLKELWCISFFSV